MLIKCFGVITNAYSWATPFEDQRYFDAVNVILSLQNSDGGWATYELQRGPAFLEYINPAEVFGKLELLPSIDRFPFLQTNSLV
jgi:squalene cyclase